MAQTITSPAGTGRQPGAQTDLKLADAWGSVLFGWDISHRYLLVFRFVLLNVALVACATAVFLQGWLDDMIASDALHLVKIIGIVFLLGLAYSGEFAVKLSRELNEVKGRGFSLGSRAGTFLRSAAGTDSGGRRILLDALRMKLASRLGTVRYVANTLVLLGLVGTVIGFIMALAGISPGAVADVESIGPMVTSMLEGMSVALYTTLAGALLNIWLMLDYRLLDSGATHFLTALMEEGERHARS